MEISVRARTVCFTGHRRVGRDIDGDEFRNTVLELIKSGYDTFICGGAVGFDTLAARLVLAFKHFYPDIKLHLYLPCNNQDARWSAADRAEYKKILERADYVDMPESSYYDGCMRERNYKMVDDSSVCVCYLNSDMRSGTAQTVRYAERMGLNVINVANPRR